jgi:hypothetical protein
MIIRRAAKPSTDSQPRGLHTKIKQQLDGAVQIPSYTLKFHCTAQPIVLAEQPAVSIKPTP